MQFISAKPLIEKYRSGAFQEAEIAPYFMAYMILMAVASGFAFGDANVWAVATGFASIVITVMGVLHLKKQNGGSFGNSFLSKYFSLGWVITFRILIMVIPAAIVFSVLAVMVGGHDAADPVVAFLTIAFEILFYRWLGSLIAESNEPISREDAAPNA